MPDQSTQSGEVNPQYDETRHENCAYYEYILNLHFEYFRVHFELWKNDQIVSA